MKKTLLIISLLTIFLISGFAKNNQTDSIAAANQTVELKKLNAKVDSLLKITNELSKERNYFSTALSSQTMIFSIIITIALAFAGVFSVKTIKDEIKKHKNETKLTINKQDEKINKIEEVNKKHDYNINNALANVAILIRDLYKKDYMNFIYSLRAAKYHLLNNNYLQCELALKKLTELLNGPVFSTDSKSAILNVSKDIEVDLKLLTNSGNEKIRNMAIKINCKYLEIKEQEPVVEVSPKA